MEKHIQLAAILVLSTIYLCDAGSSVATTDNEYGRTSVMQLVPVNDCKFRFKNQTFGVIASPWYPLNYPKNISCEWRIETTRDSRIVLTVKQFILPLGHQILINDGRQMQVFNLQNPPNDILFLNSANVTISLTTSNFTNFTNQGSASNGQRIFYTMFESERCGGILTDDAGYITVPQYIHTTDRPHECVWSIISSKNTVITLDFVQFDVQPGSCVYNNVYIRDGDKTGGYIIGDFCEENPPLSQLRTTTNVMTISYRTRPSMDKQKLSEMLPSIKMFYRMVDSCGGELEGYSGSFVTPKKWREEMFTCNWTITVPQGKQIQLNLRKLNVTRTISDFTNENQVETVKVIDLNNPNLILWNYKKGEDHPPQIEFLVRYNKVQVIWSSYPGRKSVHPLLFFQGFYEAVAPNNNNKDCVSVASQMLFTCEEKDYIDCTKRCDSIADCVNGNDERNCALASLDGISNSLDALSSKHRFDMLNKKTNKWSYYTILLMSSAGIIVLVVTAFIVVDRFIKGEVMKYRGITPDGRSDQDDYSTPDGYERIQPPPYKEVDDSSLLLMAAAGFQQQQPPPPYYSFETTSEGGASTGAISRSSFTPTALFHDTDIIDSSSGTQSYSPTPFRYTDDQDDTEAFLKEIETLKEE